MFQSRRRIVSLQRAYYSTSAVSIKKVCIIGGGVAGLQTADKLKNLNLEPTIFEQKPDVGGVWRANYADFGLQVPYHLY
jgi:cation diffusion facilitator CzcD-associated flavoprotein CzcO